MKTKIPYNKRKPKQRKYIEKVEVYNKYKSDVNKLIDKIGIRDVITACEIKGKRYVEKYKKENKKLINQQAKRYYLKKFKERKIFIKKQNRIEVKLNDGIIDSSIYIPKSMRYKELKELNYELLRIKNIQSKRIRSD